MVGHSLTDFDDELKKECETGKLYVHGFDKHGRPVQYQRPRRQNTKNYNQQVRQVAYFLERHVNQVIVFDRESAREH